MAIINVKDLVKKYPYHKKEPGFKGSLQALFYKKILFSEAVRGISFNIKNGELVGFLGPNGAGKTTTLKILSGIIHPNSGEVRVLGYTPYQRQKQYQKQFSLVMGQKNQLLVDLPARESFILLKEIYEIPDNLYRKNLAELVTLLQVGDILDIQVRKLSLGQRMKCELIAALLHTPKVLFLDEPTIGLDVLAQKNIRDFIKKYNQEKKTTIILTSHYMEDIRELAKRVIIINLGQIIYDGNLSELINRYAGTKDILITFQKGVTRKDLEKFGEITNFSSLKADLRIRRDNAKKVASAILSSSLPVEDILINETSIDDIIREIFRGKKTLT